MPLRELGKMAPNHNMADFKHQALNLKHDYPLVYTATSKHYFYFRTFISKFVLEHAAVPLNPFMIFEYFMLDTVERDLVRAANNSIVARADEVWVFGSVSDGVLAEIKMAKDLGKPIKYFKIVNSKDIVEITKDEVMMENEVLDYQGQL